MTLKQQFLFAVKASIEQQFLEFTGEVPPLEIMLVEGKDRAVERLNKPTWDEKGSAVSVILELPPVATMTMIPRDPSKPASSSGSGGSGQTIFSCPKCGKTITVS